MEQQMKRCSKCKELFPATKEYFCANSYNKTDGLRGECKKCQSEYRIKYYGKNKEKESIKNKEYKNKHCEELKIKQKKYYAEHRKQCINASVQWAKNNPEKNKENNLKFYSKHPGIKAEYAKKKRNKNPEKYNFLCKQSKLKKPEYYREMERIKAQKRRARSRKLPTNYSKNEWHECKQYFNNRCAYCGKQLKNLTQDHIIPLLEGGAYVKQNIIPACLSCNSSKSANDMETWYRQQPFFSQERLSKIYDWMGVKDGIQQLKII